MVQYGMGAVVGAFLVSMLLGAMTPRAADAMCCVCRTCPGAEFCVDGLNNSLTCATLCVTSGCSSAVFDSVDTCAGCDGVPVVPTATPSDTPSYTPTSTVTGTVTGTVTQTPTTSPTPTFDLSGRVRYYVDDRPVSGVDVALIAGTTAFQVTDANGFFGFQSIEPGEQTLDPTKQGDFRTAITALDASFVLEFVAGLRSFTPDQRLAADVTANGTVSALDGTRILQLQAGIITRFGSGFACFSDWVFRPTPMILPNQTLVQPELNQGMCTRGVIEYGNLFMPPAPNQNFVAILFGDTTGNWNELP